MSIIYKLIGSTASSSSKASSKRHMILMSDNYRALVHAVFPYKKKKKKQFACLVKYIRSVQKMNANIWMKKKMRDWKKWKKKKNWYTRINEQKNRTEILAPHRGCKVIKSTITCYLHIPVMHFYSPNTSR